MNNSQLHTLLVTENVACRTRDEPAARLARELRHSQRATELPVSTRPRRFRRFVLRAHGA